MILLQLFCSVGMTAGCREFSSTSCQLRYLGLKQLPGYLCAPSTGFRPTRRSAIEAPCQRFGMAFGEEAPSADEGMACARRAYAAAS